MTFNMFYTDHIQNWNFQNYVYAVFNFKTNGCDKNVINNS